MFWGSKTEGEQAAKRPKLDEEGTASDPYVVPAEEVMVLTIVNEPEEIFDKGAKWFCPAFTHQVFGQDEVVRGYETCKVEVYLHASTMHAFVRISFTGKQERADDIPHMLDENLGLQYTSDPEVFKTRVRATETALRTALASLKRASTTANGGVPSDRGEIVSFKPFREENAELRSLHDRLQAMPLLYVDGANYIDNTDPRWEIYLALKGGAIAGFATVYSFYAYPARERLRLSQILVFPPFQRRGLASSLLERVYADAAAGGALDLTVEDPSDEFQLLREKVDVRRLSRSDQYAGAVEDALRKSKEMLANGMKAETLLLPTKRIYTKAESELKIHRAQLRKLWEVLLLRELRRSGWQNADQVVKQIVTHRLSSTASEKKLQAASQNKHIIDRNKDNFIMTRMFLPVPFPKTTEQTEEERAKALEYDAERIGARMVGLEKLLIGDCA